MRLGSSSTSTAIDCQPTDAVMPDDVTLPILGSSSSTGAATAAHALFRFQTTSTPAPTQIKNSNTSANLRVTSAMPGSQEVMNTIPSGPWAQPSRILDDLRRPLRIPEPLQARGLTRSQLIFSIGTSIDPRALKINGDDEFYLFMEQRAQNRWTSFGMTTPKWAAATNIYNAQLEELSKKKHFVFIKKNPRALMEKLAEIEPKILDRVSRNNYTCTLHLFAITFHLY